MTDTALEDNGLIMARLVSCGGVPAPWLTSTSPSHPCHDRDVDEQEHLTDDQRKHLDFIQAVITRLSTSSSTAKGWGLTVAMAAFGFSATRAIPFVAVLGLITVCFFGVLDSYYLREERLFRELYNDARRGQIEVYSMDKNAYRGRCPQRKVVRSWSIAGFYGPLAVVGAIALVWVLCH